MSRPTPKIVAKKAPLTYANPSSSARLWRGLPRGVILIFCLAVFITVLMSYAGSSTLAVCSVILTDGIPAALWIVCCGGLGKGMAQFMGIDIKGALGVSTCAGLGTGIASLLMLGMGLAGVLSQTVVVGLMLAGFLWGFGPLIYRNRARFFEPLGPRASAWLRDRRTWATMWLATMPFLAMAVVGACLMPGLLWRPDDPHPYDVLVYHLQVPREWFEMGKIVALDHNVYSYFPFNAEMHFLAMMYLKNGPWAGMYAAQFVNVIFAILTVVTLYGAVRKLSPDPGKGSATIAGVITAGIPWVVMPASVAYVESFLTLMTSLCVAWALIAFRSAHQKDQWKCWAIAGIFAGLAGGTKLTALAMVLGGIPVACLAVAIARRALGRTGDRAMWPHFKGVALFVCAGMLAVSPWLIRNYVWAGNPVFPVAMRALGARDYDATQIVRFERAHSATDAQKSLVGRLNALWHEFGGSWKYAYCVWPVALAGVMISWRRSESWMLAILALFMVAVWLFATHLMSRFLVPAIAPIVLLIGLTYWRSAAPAIAGIGILCIGCGWLFGLHGPLARFTEIGRNGLFGIQDMSVIVPEVLQEVEDGTRTVYMVGDSQAFLHPNPMSHLRYRTVFDLRTIPQQSAVDAWLGLDAATERPRQAVIYIDPLEAERLSRTYWGVKDLDPSQRKESPYVIEANDSGNE